MDLVNQALLNALKELYRICIEDEGYQPYNPKMRQARAAIEAAEAPPHGSPEWRDSMNATSAERPAGF